MTSAADFELTNSTRAALDVLCLRDRDARVVDQRQTIARLQQELAAKNAVIADKDAMLDDKCRELEDISDALVDEFLKSYRLLQKKDTEISDKKAKIVALNKKIGQMERRDRSRSPRRCVIPDMTVAFMKETIQLKDQTIEALQGKLLARDRELIEKRDRITDLEAKLESKERLIDLKDKLVERMMDMIRSR